MGHRVMTDSAKNAAEAYRRSRPLFDQDPATDTVAWPTKSGYVWIRKTPGQIGHLSGVEEARPKLYDFEVQRAKSDTGDQMPPEAAFTGVLKAWAEEFERLTPRSNRSESPEPATE